MCLMVATRPNLAHAVGVLSHFSLNPGKVHWEALKGVIHYIKATAESKLVYV
jgi:hypothetical protein